MRKNVLTLCATVCILLSHNSNGQSPFATIDSLNIGNISSSVLVHGDMNWDPKAGGFNRCEFPKGSSKHVSHLTSIWMAGYDAQSQLHVAAQTYRQSGNDYWPGPLDNNATLNLTTSTDWARIWKVSQSDIISHLANSTHTTSNTPKDILEWPAKGNPHAKGNNSATLTITKAMAPFIDVNNDGIYNALDGDYPMIKGDQTLWWVFSDNGPTHNNTNMQPLQIEVYAMAYAFSRNTLIDNVIFYEMHLNNRSNNDYTDFRIGVNADMDLGYFRDDYAGFDSSRRLAYTYNASTPDGTGQTNSYGNNPPIAGFTLLQIPGDNANNKLPAGSFITYNNDFTIIGNPLTGSHYSNYLRAITLNGNNFHNDYTGYGNITTGLGQGPVTRYMFYGNPADTNEWSECSSNNPAGDRRFVLASSDYSFKAQTSTSFAFALVVTDTGQNTTCPSIDITKIQRVSDTAWDYYNNPPSQVSIENIAKGKALGLHPNPAKSVLYISAPLGIKANKYQISVYDVMGKKVNTNYKYTSNKIEMNVSKLPSGIYHVVYSDGQTKQSGTFVKE